MPSRFDSSRFFSDPFFTQTSENDNGYVTIYGGTAGATGTDYDCIYDSELDPTKHTVIATKTGSWVMIHIQAEEWESANGANSLPILQTKCSLNGIDYFVEQRDKAGDVIVIYALGSQRKTGR